VCIGTDVKCNTFFCELREVFPAVESPHGFVKCVEECECVLLLVCMVATVVEWLHEYLIMVTVCNSNPHCHYISAHCYQYVR
jgi:hypothetical protein